MRKRVVSLLLCCILLIPLYGCGAGGSSDAAEQLEALQKENDELKKKLEVSSSSSEATTAATHYGCSYFVPKSWEEDNSTEVEKYYYPDNGMLMVQLTPETYVSINSPDEQEEFFSGQADAFNDFNLISSGVISNENEVSMLRYKATCVSDGINWLMDFAVFNSEDGLFCFLMATDKDSDSDYSESFQRIVDSIKLDEPSVEQKTTSEPTETATPEPTETATPEPTPTPTPAPVIESYDSGMYKVGVDIPAGEYIVLNTGSRRNGYFSVTSDANGDDILFNDNFQYNSIITISDGEYLELSASTAYPFDEWCSQNTIDTTQYGCMLKVGVNIPAGEYKIEATGDHGYYCIYPDSRQQDIISNDNFEGQSYVSVSDGQYLVLSKCSIIQ